MDESKEQQPQEPPPSYAEAAGTFFLIVLVAFISLVAFMSLAHEPLGIQIATLISYTGVVSVYTFCRARSEFTSYSVDEPYVQEQFPSLLGIHCVYSVVLYFGEGWALSLRPALSAWWLHSSGSKGIPPFDQALMGAIGAMALSQILLSRAILARARRQEQALEQSDN